MFPIYMTPKRISIKDEVKAKKKSLKKHSITQQTEDFSILNTMENKKKLLPNHLYYILSLVIKPLHCAKWLR